jgi:glycosyltransferase involved in cell wall biosynthesis
MGHQVRVAVNIDGRYYCTDDLTTFHPLTVPLLDNGPLRWLEKGVRRVQYELNLPYAAFFESVRFGLACRQAFQNFDLLFERMSWASYGGALAARWLHIPLVLENNGDHLADLVAKGIAPQGMQRQLSLAVTGWGVRQAAHVVVSGDGWRREFGRRWGTVEADMTTVENGTILVEILSREQLRSCGNKTARVEPIFIYLGGFYPWQGVPVLLRAFARAQAQGMQATLQLIGSGSGLAEAEQLVSELGLNDCVSFTGRLSPEQYALVLADADVGVAPYCGWPEFSGLKTFDYKAAGLPTISSGQEGMPTTLTHGRTALIIPPCDEDALTQALRQLAAQPELRRQMGQAARVEAENEHAWVHTVQRLVQVFQQVLNESSIR